jgi:two-component system OmpR family sensor kinase
VAEKESGSKQTPQGQLSAADSSGNNSKGEAQPEDLIIQLREAIRARDDFLAIVSHELRNPLTPILLGLELIRKAERSQDRPTFTQELERLERQVKHFVARTTVLLEVAQITSGKFQLTRTDVNVSDLVAGIVVDYLPLAQRVGSELRADIQNSVVIEGDSVALSEIVENLLSNGIKYGLGKPIEIAVSATTEAVEIKVRDRGLGIAEKDRERIFERFERAVGKRPQSGFGIGLWLSRNLITLMGGSITVLGEPGLGSLFTVSLPLKQGKIDE